jgi:poly(U)-specific endoribonuclease
MDETDEAYAFLRACMTTPVMKYSYSYCKAKLAEREQETSGKTTKYSKLSFGTEEDFVDLLYKIWFQLYSRSRGCADNDEEDSSISDDSREASRKRIYGSSGFEHVFVGEIRKSKVIGLHNWIQLYMQEKAGNLDYRGAMRAAGPQARVLTYNLKWNGTEKPVGSSLIGVSPEFELAMYTMVFLVGSPKDNVLLLDLGDGDRKERDRFLTKLDVKCFRTKGRVGTCYVELLS